MEQYKEKTKLQEVGGAFEKLGEDIGKKLKKAKVEKIGAHIGKQARAGRGAKAPKRSGAIGWASPPKLRKQPRSRLQRGGR